MKKFLKMSIFSLIILSSSFLIVYGKCMSSAGLTCGNGTTISATTYGEKDCQCYTTNNSVSCSSSSFDENGNKETTTILVVCKKSKLAGAMV